MAETTPDRLTDREIESYRLLCKHHPEVRLGEINWPMVLGRTLDEVERARAELAAARRDLAALQQRHAVMRTALSFVRAWPDGVTGKCMVDAEDLLTILDADSRAVPVPLAGQDQP